MSEKDDSLGGAEHVETSTGRGSSPRRPTKNQLRARLRILDRKLNRFDQYGSIPQWYRARSGESYRELDAKRKAIRLELKAKP